MPALSNSRHELFAQVLAAGCSATDAYVKAGHRLNKGNAGRLKANEHIRKRVQELQARNVQAQEAAVDVTIEQLRAQFAEAYEVAKELSQPTAMSGLIANVGLTSGFEPEPVITEPDLLGCTNARRSL